jgi:predicted RNA-binding protein Jag
MSKYGQTQTVLQEEKFIVEVLKAMGYEVEVHSEGAQLNSYYAEQEAKTANILIGA